MIQASDINKYYMSGKSRLHVLKGINLEIKEAEVAAIVGPSGAGKTTLLNILGGLDRSSCGEVYFEGKALSRLSDASLSFMRNKFIGFIFQFYHLLSEFTSIENVMMPALINNGLDKRAIKEKAAGLLDKVGLGQRAGHFPNQLSGGEQQRVAIARALMNEPRLLLCDEPTGNLDSENGKEVSNLLIELNREKKMTIIMVTHNLDIARLAQKVYNIKDGELVNN